MTQISQALREDVRLLGETLGETILKHEGAEIFHKIENIRNKGKAINGAAQQDSGNSDSLQLLAELDQLQDRDILPISRAFNQFLNLANIAEQEYHANKAIDSTTNLDHLLQTLAQEKGESALNSALTQLNIELVLTAHPTEATRRTLIKKYDAVATALSALRREDLLPHEIETHYNDIKRLIEEIWCTNEIRDQRPSAVDEARWGFAVVENTLWTAIPEFIRHFDSLCKERTGWNLPLDCKLFSLYSWMGGDRDGNPNVTHTVTDEVLLMGRRNAANLYLKDVNELISSLSMSEATHALHLKLDGPSSTPYRDLLSQLRTRIENTVEWCEAGILKHESFIRQSDIITSRQDLLEPLTLCWDSLNSTGLDSVATGPLLDTIRRVHCFGINLLPLDIRQDGERHTKLLNELTQYYDLGAYLDWEEEKRQTFLLEQLQSKRPLFPRDWPVSDNSAEVIATCRALANEPQETLSHYIISMAQKPSDVLAVALILKECGLTWDMPIVPLFETLDDLDNAPEVMEKLWQLPWYKNYAGEKQTVMIGYSDSAKDAGRFAATWAQYKAQEKLVQLAEKYGVKLTLFHGRGGTVGRGGGPVEKAMASQPPGSVNGCIRVTEQGEMIRYKFGRRRIAFKSLSTYVAATLRATLDPHASPEPEWRDFIEEMAQKSLQKYRHIVREDPSFVPYFRSLTPEQELNKLALGSRPAKRKAEGGVESLRAIPWVFAWTQVRLNLPAWLGVNDALTHALDNDPDMLNDMLQKWPFFSSFIDLIEMVLGKADENISSLYEKQLVAPELHDLGQHLRSSLTELKELIKTIKQEDSLLQGDAELQGALKVRKPYIDPLNILQVELMKRERKAGNISPELERALKVTMAGIAAGMRNTG